MAVTVSQLAGEELAAARALLVGACRFDRAAEVAEEKLFGGGAEGGAATAIAAREGEQVVGVAVTSGRWLRILAVSPPARGRGVGTALLAAAEQDLKRAGHRVMRTMDQPGNYLAPGIDARDRETIEWLHRRGFVAIRENTNLTIDLKGNPRADAAHARALAERAAGDGYVIRRATEDDRPPLLAMVQAAFGRAWPFEVARALNRPPSPGVHLAIERASGVIAAFAAHDGNNRGLGWFGPAGTLEGHRGRGLGGALLAACLVDIAAAGHDCCEVAWIGPRAFYERAAGVAGERTFVVLEKELLDS